MSIKFNPNYTLVVGAIDGSDIGISFPLTMEFNISRCLFSSVESCTIRIRNLNLQTRLKIFKDWQNASEFRKLILSAGYGPPPLPTIFNGCVKTAYSYKDSGSTDFITEIEGWLGYVPQNAYINQTLAGTPSNPISQQLVVNTLVQNLVNTPNSLSPGNSNSTGLRVGYITRFNGSYPRGRVLMGRTWDLLQQEVGYNAYINNNQINILGVSMGTNGNQFFDAFGGSVFNINASTGLLTSPRRSNSFVDVDIVFEPGIQSSGQLVNLHSQSVPNWNGIYRVQGLTHRGIISGSINGKRVTKLNLQAESTQFNPIGTTGLPPIPEGVLG